MKILKVNNLNEIWELQKIHNNNFIAVYDKYNFFYIINNNIVEISLEEVLNLEKISQERFYEIVNLLYIEEQQNKKKEKVQEKEEKVNE